MTQITATAAYEALTLEQKQDMATSGAKHHQDLYDRRLEVEKVKLVGGYVKIGDPVSTNYDLSATYNNIPVGVTGLVTGLVKGGNGVIILTNITKATGGFLAANAKLFRKG